MGFGIKNPFSGDARRSSEFPMSTSTHGQSGYSAAEHADDASYSSGKHGKGDIAVSQLARGDEVTTTVDPTLNPGALSFEEGESSIFFLIFVPIAEHLCLQMRLVAWGDTSVSSVARC